jgi:RNA polymerase sigma-70 factor (ECF subfamily)
MIHPAPLRPIDPIQSSTARPEPDLSDKEVVARVLLGETSLYEILVRRHNPRLYKFLRGILGNHEEVEDVMQEAHFRAMKHLNQFEGRSSFVTWLSRVMINEAYTHLRRRRVFQPLGLSSESGEGQHKEFASTARNPEQHVIQQELSEILEEAVDSLPELYRVVFALRELGEASAAEAAARLGVTEQCVKSRRFRARRLLQQKISCVALASVGPVTPPRV